MPQGTPMDDPRHAGGLPRRTVSRIRDGWKAGVTRRATARGAVPDSFSYLPDALVVGSPETAAALMRGQFVLAGASARVERNDPWRIDPPTTGWAEALHGFGWLDHFRAVDGDPARKAVRKMTDGWLHRHGKAGGLAWRPPVAGDRVAAWCRNGALLTENAEPVYRSDLFRSLAAQARYLSKTASGEALPLDRLRAHAGVAYAGLCVAGEGAVLKPGLEGVLNAAKACLTPGGIAASRNPSDLLHVLHVLVQLREDLKSAGEGALAGSLTPLIERAAPALRMMRLGSTGLALFHGGREEDEERVNLVLVESGDTSPAPVDAGEGGYLRLSASGIAAIMDAGAPAEGQYARRSHAAPLALSFTSGNQRIVVNCGSGVHLGPEWEGPCRASAAHSTLTVAERSPCEFEGSTKRRFRRLGRCARIVDRQSQRDDSGIWALAAHDGYAARHGLVHYRRLFLDADGVDFRGEDTLTLAKGGARVLERSRARRKSPDGPRFAVRFHLHPDIAVTVADGKANLILPDGETWQMMQSGGSLSVDDSVYIPGPVAPVPSKQIVIESSLRDTEGQVRWAFKRMSGRSIETADEVGEA